METIITKLANAGIIPVAAIKNVDYAVPLAAALRRGGLNCIEVTYRTEAAEESIRRISVAFPDMLVAAGTVLNNIQANSAVLAGASFIVTPGFNSAVVAHCLERKYPIIPGVCTPSEIEQAMGFGLKLLKFFPSEAIGGIKMINALAAPYSNVRFMPTGGINSTNVFDYLQCKNVLACGGSWMIPTEALNEGHFDIIEELTKKAVEIYNKVRGERNGV